MAIPMPGHSVGSDPEQHAKLHQQTADLERLIAEHDVVFLLLDSREARWLPTVQAIAHNKLVVTIAVGFDTFLVMRHGLSPAKHAQAGGKRLGCYFCNDVVAPTNSLNDRTLDQQCTVSRPALVTMSGAMGVELVTSILNHPKGNAAQAHEDFLQCDRSNLGIIPQQMRGDLNTFEIKCMYGEAFERCTGCSHFIQEAYLADRQKFMLSACNEPDFLENVSGLAAMN